jgi:hypothetical protein
MKKHIQMELIDDFFRRLERVPKKKQNNSSTIKKNSMFTSVKYSRTIRLPSREHDLSQITEDFLINQIRINRKNI